MAVNKNKERDARILKKMLTLQDELNNGLHRHKIVTASDLSGIDPIVRRGLMHLVGDIFERTNELTDGTKKAMQLNIGMVRDFRNAVYHNYGSVDNVRALAFLTYCASKDTKKNVKVALSAIEDPEIEQVAIEDTVVLTAAAKGVLVILRNSGGVVQRGGKDDFIFRIPAYTAGLDELKEKGYITYDGNTATLISQL